MIEVRVRHVDDAKAVRLMDWPAERLDDVLPMLRAWEIRTAHGDVAVDTLVGQIVVEDNAAFFEVVIDDADD
jgi:hypothetical protein